VNNYLLNLIIVLDKNPELLKIIVGVIFFLLWFLFLRIGRKLLNVICLKLLHKNEQQLNDLLDSSDKQKFSSLIKIIYASFIIAISIAALFLASKTIDFIESFLFKITQILYTTSQVQCLDGYMLFRLVVNIGCLIGVVVISYVIIKLVILISNNTKYDLKKFLRAQNKGNEYTRIRLIATIFVITLVPLFLYVDVNLIEPMLHEIATICWALN